MADIDSILTSTKKMLGIPKEETVFDLDVIIHINSVLSTLQQLGVGLTATQHEITDESDVWADVLTSQKNLSMIKSYIYLRVRQMFDPQTTGFATDSADRMIKEMEWRITVAASSGPDIPFPDLPEEGRLWDLTGGIDFPDEAPIGARGIDLITGQTWEKN